MRFMKGFEPVIPEVTRRGPDKRDSERLSLSIRLAPGLTTIFDRKTVPLPGTGLPPFVTTVVTDFKIGDTFVDFATTFIFNYYAR